MSSVLAAHDPERKKTLGAFYTPREVAKRMVRWVVRSENDKLLDPSCGDGQFLSQHRKVVGVDRDIKAVVEVAESIPGATVHAADFFDWAANTNERFACVAGNPPFIRYQRFNGETRKIARRLCDELGTAISGLASSWAPFVVVASSLLESGGRLAFVVPAEIGHAPYARPVLDHLMRNFTSVHVMAIREKVFPQLSEDVWLLYASGAGGTAEGIRFSAFNRFENVPESPPAGVLIPKNDLDEWNGRLRPFLLPKPVRELYRGLRHSAGTIVLGEAAQIGIGYVTGANDFFHLRPSEAKRLSIPAEFLVPTVRRSAFLPPLAVTHSTLRSWYRRDEPVLLLRILPETTLPKSVVAYLNSKLGEKARTAYKCRVRKPWYSVPHVKFPDAFLAYMSGSGPSVVANRAGCSCTNSVHALHMRSGVTVAMLQMRWTHPMVALSCEIEGHPLGGGMLKLEPGEASRLILPAVGQRTSKRNETRVADGLELMRMWRHHA